MAETVDEYIAAFPEDVQGVLQQLRRVIHEEVPEAGEKISYRIPTITRDGRYVVYFAGYERHVGMYPVPPAGEDLEPDLARYRSGKATVRFPLSEPLPFDLVRRIVAFLLAQHASRRR